MPSCSVKWCSNHTSTCSLKSKNGVSFHRFPKDEAMCQKWVEAVRFERRDPWWTSSNASRICSLHFKESDISSTPCKVNILAKTAVPICTMVWYDDNESNVTEKPPSDEITNIVKILKTYERKKNNMNVLKEKTVNISNKLNVDEKSQRNKVVNPTITSGIISQTNLTRELDTKLLKTEASKTQIYKEFQESSADENLNIAQKNTALTALSNECVKYYQENYKTNILIKLNDNTNLVVDEDRINNTDLKESNKVSKDLNTGRNENSMKLILKEIDTNENKEPNKEEINQSNTDMFAKTIKNGYVELNANVSNTYLGKILKTYLPKRRPKICGKNIRETCNRKEMIDKNKGRSINMEKGLNNVNCKEIKKIKVNIYPKDAFIKNKHCNNNNLTRVQKSLTRLKENKQVYTNVKKRNFKRINKLFEISKIEQDKPHDIPNMEANNESNVTDIKLIANQSKIDNNLTDDVNLEFFENAKTIENVPDIPNNDNQELNKNSRLELNTYADMNINSTLDKVTNKTPFIFNLDKNDSELTSFVNLELTEDNTNDTFINKRLTQFNENDVNKSNHQLPHLHSEFNENNIKKSHNNMIYSENFTKNAIIFPNNELHLQSTVINNITAETKRDAYIELKKHLYKKPKLKSLAELCSNILTDNDKNLFSTYNNIMSTEITAENETISDCAHNTEIDKNIHMEVKDTVPTQNSINDDSIKEKDNVKQINSISLEEFITNLSPQSNNSEIMDFITNLNKDLNKTLPELDINISDIDIKCQKLLEKPEIKTLFPLKLNKELLKDDRNRQFKDINTENHDKDSLHRETNKDFENVLPIIKDQEIINEHMDSILNRDTDPDFDLGLLLSDTPIEEEFLKVDDSNSLDDIEGSPNWIQLPIDELPKIIDDIMNQVSPFFENLDIFDKVNTLNLDNAAIKEDESKNSINDQYSTSNFEQFKEQIIDNYCEIGKQCRNKSISQIDKQLINEFSDYNEPNLEQSSNICNVKVNQSKRLSAEKCYDLYDEQTDKQILEYYIQSNNEKCDDFNQEPNLVKCYEKRNIDAQGNKSINQIPNYGLSKSDQIEDSLNNEYFKQTEQSRKDQGGELDIDNNVFNYEDIPKVNRKKSVKQSNKHTSLSSVDQLRTSLEESTPKLKTQNQPNLQSSGLEINKQNSEDFNEKTIEEVNSNISIKDHIVDTKSVPKLNSEQLKRVIFEQCFDPECGDNCKNQKHKSISELHGKDVQLPQKQTNNTPYQPDIKTRKRRYDLFYKRQCIDNFKKQLQDGSLNSDIRQKKHFIEHNLSSNDNKTKYKQIPIEKLPGKYIELRWIESEGKSNPSSPKRKHQKLGFEQSDNKCDNKNGNISQQTECPECGYTDENNLLDYQNMDMDLKITRPLSLINKDMLLSLRNTITENNNNNNQVSIKSVYAMEFAYVTAIQALEKKLKQKIAISDYRLRRVNNLSKINNKLIETNIMLMDIADENKI